MSLMLKFSWEMLFFESGDTEVFKADRSKLFASNKRQIDNHTLMLDMLHSYMSVVCTYHCRGVFKKVFFVTQGNLQGERVEDHRMMFTWHLYLMQSYIQAVLYIYITDYMMALTLYTPISECIFSKLFSVYFLMCWQGEFVLQSRGSSIDYHFLYSHDLNV